MNPVTLCGVKQARKGYRFLHMGASEACKGCELFKVCSGNLEKGRVYEIKALGRKVFPCPIHEGGVRVVIVEEAELFGALESKKAIPGATIVFEPQPCDRRDCDSHRLCHPEGLKPQDRCQILSVMERIPCPEKRDLRKALLKLKPRETEASKAKEGHQTSQG
jgi:uncharacterized protein (UPF0179 family)